jgi:hypothetical protein
VEIQPGRIEMTARLQPPCTDKAGCAMDCRNINLLTTLSKLAIALVMGIVVMAVSLLG